MSGSDGCDDGEAVDCGPGDSDSNVDGPEDAAPDRIVDAEKWVQARFGEPEAEAMERYGDAEVTNVPEAPDYSTVQPDRDTAVSFWAAVVYANVGLFLIALGPMLAYFRGQVPLGAGLVVAGLLALGRVYTIYRAYLARRAERERRAGEDRGNVADEDS